MKHINVEVEDVEHNINKIKITSSFNEAHIALDEYEREDGQPALTLAERQMNALYQLAKKQ